MALLLVICVKSTMKWKRAKNFQKILRPQNSSSSKIEKKMNKSITN